MLLNYADNALMAKVRALYGKRLRNEDYQRLLQSKSIAEVAAYLKNDTAYADTLSQVKEDLIHRGQLETFVRRRNLDIFVKFLRYSYNDKLFLTVYTMKNEVDQLLLAIRFLNAGAMDRYIVALPAYLSRYMSFDLFALAKIRNYDELLDIVSHSSFYHVLTKYRPVSSDRPVDLIACERALLEQYYNTILDMVDKDYSGDTQEDLRGIIGAQVDYHNLSAAYRLRRYFGYKPERIREAMLQVKTDVNPSRAYDAILYANGDREIDDALRTAYVVRKFRLDWKGGGRHELSIELSRSRNYRNHRAFRFSTKPMVVVLTYMYLLDIEVDNITNIIEGIRYHIPPEDIRELLVIS